MNGREIVKARKEYEQSLALKESLVSIKEELKALEENSFVKRYKEICSYSQVDVPSDEEMIVAAFRGVDKTESNFKIYLFMGAYKRSSSCDENDCIVSDLNEADYLVYANLEDEYETISIAPIIREKFEIENIVLKCNTSDVSKKYYELQTVLYRELLIGDFENKEDIVERIKCYLK